MSDLLIAGALIAGALVFQGLWLGRCHQQQNDDSIGYALERDRQAHREWQEAFDYQKARDSRPLSELLKYAPTRGSESGMDDEEEAS